jgi:hypothetical protein
MVPSRHHVSRASARPSDPTGRQAFLSHRPVRGRAPALLPELLPLVHGRAQLHQCGYHHARHRRLRDAALVRRLAPTQETPPSLLARRRELPDVRHLPLGRAPAFHPGRRPGHRPDLPDRARPHRRPGDRLARGGHHVLAPAAHPRVHTLHSRRAPLPVHAAVGVRHPEPHRLGPAHAGAYWAAYLGAGLAAASKGLVARVFLLFARCRASEFADCVRNWPQTVILPRNLQTSSAFVAAW